MGDHLWTCILSRYVISHPGQLSLTIPVWVGARSTSLGWEGNCKSGVALAMRHRQYWFIHLPAQRPMIGRRWAPHLRSFGVWPSFTFNIYFLYQAILGCKWQGFIMMNSINSITRLGLPGTRDRGRPRKTWSACVRNDMTICNLDGVNPLDRNSWGTSVRRCPVLPTPESGTTAAP